MHGDLHIWDTVCLLVGYDFGCQAGSVHSEDSPELNQSTPISHPLSSPAPCWAPAPSCQSWRNHPSVFQYKIAAPSTEAWRFALSRSGTICTVLTISHQEIVMSSFFSISNTVGHSDVYGQWQATFFSWHFLKFGWIYPLHQAVYSFMGLFLVFKNKTGLDLVDPCHCFPSVTTCL